MALNPASPAGQLQRFRLGEGVAAAIGGWHRFVAGGALIAIHHPDRLAAQALAHDRRETLLEGGLEDQVFIRVHRPLHHVLPQAVGGGEQHGVAKACFGVDAEHHP